MQKSRGRPGGGGGRGVVLQGQIALGMIIENLESVFFHGFPTIIPSAF